MRISILTLFLGVLNLVVVAQNQLAKTQNNRKGKAYFYWGWNREVYSKSNIRFTGDSYDFTLKKVVAKDRPSKFSLNTYLNPLKATIPQTNFRVGYFINNKWDISFGMDHMKYVAVREQSVKISGEISNSKIIYNGVYSNDDISLTDGFLQYEHTDGLNYFSLALIRSYPLLDANKISLRFTGGAGIGFLLPRTDVILMEQQRYDAFHLSGYGLNSIVGLNATFYNKIFIQLEHKGGYINMPDIRTTQSKSDKASQRFFFSQFNLVIGGIINFHKGTHQ